MNNSKIEWCHDTANIWWGCQEVHAGCDNCYARVLDNRWKGGHWGPHTSRRIVRSVWKDLARMQKVAAASGTIRRVFVGSMMDIFEKPMPLVDLQGNEIPGQDTGYLRNILFQQISMGIYPNLLFLFLTKRPGNILKYIPESWEITPPSNVMYGTSVVNQETADRLIPQLLQVPGKRFLSCEPLIGPMDMREYITLTDNNRCGTDIAEKRGWGYDEWSGGFAGPGSKDSCYDPEPGIHWVIAGGESGHGARPMHPDWARGLRDQCAAADVPFFFKQWGEYLPFEATAQPPFYSRVDTGEEFDSHQMNFIDMNGDPGRFMGIRWYDTYDSACMNAVNGDRDCCFLNIGKKAAGRLLDGVEHNAFPI